MKKVQNEYDDWLVCMISTQLRHQIKELEVIISDSDPGYADTGLKSSSLIRVSRLAVVDADIFEGKLGAIPIAQLDEIRKRLSRWIAGKNKSNHASEETPVGIPPR